MKNIPPTNEQIHEMIRQKIAEKQEKLFSRASKKITYEQGLYIKYRLKCTGCTSTDIATETGCSKQAVQKVLSGKSHSQRIEHLVATKLGYSSWNAMVQELREHAA